LRVCLGRLALHPLVRKLCLGAGDPSVQAGLESRPAAARAKTRILPTLCSRHRMITWVTRDSITFARSGRIAVSFLTQEIGNEGPSAEAPLSFTSFCWTRPVGKSSAIKHGPLRGPPLRMFMSGPLIKAISLCCRTRHCVSTPPPFMSWTESTKIQNRKSKITRGRRPRTRVVNRRRWARRQGQTSHLKRWC